MHIYIQFISLRVRPARVIVQREAVGPTQVCVDQNLTVRPVQVGPLDLSDVTPVGPEQEPVEQNEQDKEHNWDNQEN